MCTCVCVCQPVGGDQLVQAVSDILAKANLPLAGGERELMRRNLALQTQLREAHSLRETQLREAQLREAQFEARLREAQRQVEASALSHLFSPFVVSCFCPARSHCCAGFMHLPLCVLALALSSLLSCFPACSRMSTHSLFMCV